MANATTTNAAASGTGNTPPPERERIYILTYRQGSMLHSKHFNFRGPLKEAVQRSKEHCNTMGYKFVWTRPFVVDLAHQENLKSSGYDGNVEEHYDEA